MCWIPLPYMHLRIHNRELHHAHTILRHPAVCQRLFSKLLSSQQTFQQHSRTLSCSRHALSVCSMPRIHSRQNSAGETLGMDMHCARLLHDDKGSAG